MNDVRGGGEGQEVDAGRRRSAIEAIQRVEIHAQLQRLPLSRAAAALHRLVLAVVAHQSALPRIVPEGIGIKPTRFHYQRADQLDGRSKWYPSENPSGRTSTGCTPQEEAGVDHRICAGTIDTSHVSCAAAASAGLGLRAMQSTSGLRQKGDTMCAAAWILTIASDTLTLCR
jgi:hypothetical protein